MGIQTFVKKIQQQRQLKKAVRTGETLSSLGVTQDTSRTTTGGYVTPSGEVTVSPSGNVTTTTSGGGSSGGGGGGSSSPAPQPTPTPTPKPQPAPNSQAAKQQEQVRLAKQQGLTLEQRQAVIRRSELKRSAVERGRPYTRVEAERFLGGAKGVSNLRKATAKGYRYQDQREGTFKTVEIPAKTITQADIKNRPTKNQLTEQQYKSNINTFFSKEIKPLKELKEATASTQASDFSLLKYSGIYGLTGKNPEGPAFMTRVFSETIPTTRGEVVLTAGLPVISMIGPPVVGAVIGGAVTYTGIKTVFNPSATPEQRVAGGLIAGVGGAGLYAGAKPFLTKTGRTAPVKVQPEGFDAIQLETTRIGLIKEGSPARTGQTAGVNLPGTSPLVRGGFEVKPSEKFQFFSKDQTLTTSQIGLVKKGKIFEIEREFFTTPQEPTLGIPETRISRLGLADIFSFPKKTEVGFGAQGKPQIILVKRASVGKFETSKQFRIGTGSELEAIKSYGSLTDITKVGQTRLKGQEVDIFEATMGNANKDLIGNVNKKYGSSTEGTSRIQGETLLTQTLNQIKYTGTGNTKTTSTKSITTNITPSFSTITTTTNSRGSNRLYSYSTPTGGRSTPIPTSITPKITTPKVPTTKTPTPSTPKYPKLTPPFVPRTPSPPIIPRARPPTSNKQRKFTQRNPIKKFKGFGKFTVSLRRFGIFKPIGFAKTQTQAFDIGTQAAARTLGATFKVEGEGIKYPKKIKGFKTKKTKEGTLYIEQPKYRLSKASELKEIQLFKKRKGGKKK